ncbi:probable polygalacturonase At3g15720 isoform X1 [Macadamia integrifolia]|uniref:probable polygalacturonase At3g15720 isoform X1 n=1 Tax=Macadamia integrifolia TaxID=60698 RepID=UPI001C4E7C81|nr:probable polygalacturonase At3g15720 isoform X1 [Macadamia integrifolia]
MDRFTIFLILCMVLLHSSNGFDATVSDSFNVVKYGAVGDGKTDDSGAFLKTWTAMCGIAPTYTPTLIIPSKKTFLLKPMKFGGPCNLHHNINIKVSGNIVAPYTISGYEGHDDIWLLFTSIDRLNIYGTGQIDGRGSIWWPNSEQRRPTALCFHKCNSLHLTGLKLLNSPRNHISLLGCNGVTISHLNIIAPKDSPNTDGIVIADSTQVLIHRSHIGTGDDCVAIIGGTSFINITNLRCGPGHGISVGSLGGGGAHDTVKEVHVNDCSFHRTMNGARIKTWPGGSGYAKKISFKKIALTEVGNPIVINQYYPKNEVPYPQDINKGSDVEVSDVTFIGFQGSTTSKNAISLRCSNSVACTNIVLNHINITSAIPGNKTSSICNNAHVISKDCNPPVHCPSQKF